MGKKWKAIEDFIETHGAGVLAVECIIAAILSENTWVKLVFVIGTILSSMYYAFIIGPGFTWQI